MNRDNIIFRKIQLVVCDQGGIQVGWATDILKVVKSASFGNKNYADRILLCLTLPVPKVINFKFLPQPPQKYFAVWRPWFFIDYSDESWL